MNERASAEAKIEPPAMSIFRSCLVVRCACALEAFGKWCEGMEL